MELRKGNWFGQFDLKCVQAKRTNFLVFNPAKSTVRFVAKRRVGMSALGQKLTEAQSKPSVYCTIPAMVMTMPVVYAGGNCGCCHFRTAAAAKKRFYLATLAG